MPNSDDNRLDEWKEIAAYLGRSVRTASRWESELGLPVHRIRGRRGNIVYALKSEIDDWLQDNAVGPDDAEPSIPRIEKMDGMRTQSPFASAPAWLWVWAILATCLGAAGWVILTVGGEARTEEPENGSSIPALMSDARDLPEPRGMVVFTRSENGNADLYIANDDGKDERRLTRYPGADGYGAISSEGERIAFYSERDGGVPGIFIMNLDDTNIRQVMTAAEYPDSHIQGLSWSSDGHRILFSMRVGGKFQLFEIGADGTALHQLTEGGHDCRDPRYSLDGRRILHTRSVSFNGFTNQIYEVSELKGPRRLTELGDNAVADEILVGGVPALVYSHRTPTGNDQLYLLFPGQGERPIYPENNTYNEGSVVGPRGPGAASLQDWIIFISNRAGDGKSNLWRMKVDGSNAFQITTEGAGQPDWWVPKGTPDT
jgi:dipeptidyl aminopeptidase/acylaminoacyl peptidase